MTTLHDLRHFIGTDQRAAMLAVLSSEEGAWMDDKITEVAEVIRAMPKTRETDGQGDEAVAYLHYFIGGADWYIVEKDAGDPLDVVSGVQHQAFGYAHLFGGTDWAGGELGYISIAEIIENGAELDLYWTPKTLREIRAERRAA